jgi:hypothetical protein
MNLQVLCQVYIPGCPFHAILPGGSALEPLYSERAAKENHFEPDVLGAALDLFCSDSVLLPVNFVEPEGQICRNPVGGGRLSGRTFLLPSPITRQGATPSPRLLAPSGGVVTFFLDAVDRARDAALA